jgi:DNA-binding MarR family transcriptional regulator
MTEFDSMSAPCIITFLHVAANEGLSVSDYAELSGVSLQAMSLRLLDLSKGRPSGDQPGADLIETRPNTLNRRFVISRLTPKGKALADRLAKIMGVEKPTRDGR